MKKILFFTVLSVTAIFSYAANYSASTSGNITSYLAQLQAGDTLFIAPGVYHFSAKAGITRS